MGPIFLSLVIRYACGVTKMGFRKSRSGRGSGRWEIETLKKKKDNEKSVFGYFKTNVIKRRSIVIFKRKFSNFSKII